MEVMHICKAVVRNGRLTLDEPTDLPEGTVVELAEKRVSNESVPVRLDEEIPPEELRRFRAELHESVKQARNGELIPAEEILQEL
jgi:hypothetical protein